MGLVYKNWVTNQGERTDNSSNFSSMADFNAAGGDSAFGDVPVWVGNQLRKNGSLLINPVIPALAEFEDKLLMTNIDNISWSFVSGAGVTSELSTEHARHNTNTLMVDCPATASVNGQCNGVFPAPLDLTDYEYVEFAIWNDTLPCSAMCYMFTTPSPGLTDYYLITVTLPKLGWNICRLAKSAFTATGTPNWNDIRWCRLRLSSDVQNPRRVYFSDIYAVKTQHNRAVVSLSFDDGPISQYHAATIAASRGIKLSFFLIRHQLNINNYLATSHLEKMLAMGHELGVHGANATYNNWVEQYTAQGYDAFLAALVSNNTYFKSLGVDTEIASWPQGVYGDTVNLDVNGGPIVDAVKESGIKYNRLVNVADLAANRHYAQYSQLFPRSGMFISGGINLNNANNLAAVKAYIDTAIQSGSWINIFGHVLAATAADGVTWAKSDYIELIDYLAAKRDAGLLDVRPFGEVSRELERNGYLTTSAES